MAADLTAYVPRLLLEWEERFGSSMHEAIDGTLVFADVSGFTKLSEALARKGGKIGAEQLADVINGLFGELLLLAAARGGEMLKYGGDAMLLFFTGEQHALCGAAASIDMQKRLRAIGRVDTGGAGVVRLRMSVGAHSGPFDLFNVGRLHRELVVAGPSTSITVAMEAAADPTEVLVSPDMAAQLPSRNVGAEKAGGYLVRGQVAAPFLQPEPLDDFHDANRFLAGPLAEHLASSDGEAEHRMATVSFLQYLDLDRLLVAGRTDEAARRIDDVLTLVQETYLRFGVTFLATDLASDGGKVMAASGLPRARGDDEERMMRASRAILEAAPALPVRIGLQRGHVFAGDVGPKFRRTYTALGDVTNTAARVMGQAAPGQCLVLLSVLQGATSEWTAEPLAPFMAKGKTEPLVPWLLGHPGERRTRSSITPFVGREEEMSQLRAELSASATELRTVDVVGEPGLGKSRLLAELAGVAHNRGRQVFTVRSDPFSATIAHRAVSVLVTALAGPLDADGLRESVATRVPSLLDELPLIGLALGLELPATETTAHLDIGVLPARIAAATATFLDALVPSGAVVIAEDAHWIDEASAGVLDALRRARGANGLLLCISRRSEGGWAPADVDARLELTPLGEADALALVEAASARPLLPDDAKRLAAQAAGNPLFAEQLAAAPVDADLPDSVEEVMAARIDQLPPDARDLLRRLAVLGPSFDAELAVAVDGDALPLSVEPFVSREGATLRFSHALLQQAAYAGLTYRRRRELHRRVATHVIDSGAADDRVEELSMHCDAAAMWEETHRYATAAARSAEAQYAFAIAAIHWARSARSAKLTGAFSGEEIANAWQACGEACRRAGQIARAQSAFHSGRKVAPPGSPESVALAASIGRGLLLEGRVRPAAVWANRARRELSRLPAVPFATEAAVLELRAEIAEQRDRRAENVALARELARRAEEVGDQEIQARAQAHVHSAAVRLNLPESEREGALALDLARRAGNLRGLVNILTNLADAAQRQAQWTRASELSTRASEAAEQAGFALGRAVIDNNVGEIFVYQGRLDEALLLFERSYNTAAAARHWHAAYLTANIGWVRGLQGAFDTADDAFDRAAERLNELGLLGEVEKRRSAVALVRGDGATVLQILGSSDLSKALVDDPTLQAARSHALRQQQRYLEAQESAEQAQATADASGNAYSRLVAAEALLRLGDAGQTAVLLELCKMLGIVARPLIP